MSASTAAVQQDQLFSCLALALWCITSAKSALAGPLLTHHNLQSLVGAAAILGLGLVWPARGPCSYARWRVAALTALRFSLMALPYNFEEGLWDALFPGDSCAGRGPLAWAVTLCNVSLGTGIAMLVLTALGWRLPLRVHCALQALLVAMWIHLGVGPHSRSKLLTSPEVASAVSAVYKAGEFGVALLMPIVARPPGGLRTQAAAVLVFCWLLVGWLLPTLLLLQPGLVPPHRPARNQACSCARCQAAAGSWLARLESALLAGLHSLLAHGTLGMHSVEHGAAASQQQVPWQWGRQRVAGSSLGQLVRLGLRWACTLVLLWLPARTLAPWYAGEP